MKEPIDKNITMDKELILDNSKKMKEPIDKNITMDKELLEKSKEKKPAPEVPQAPVPKKEAVPEIPKKEIPQAPKEAVPKAPTPAPKPVAPVTPTPPKPAPTPKPQQFQSIKIIKFNDKNHNRIKEDNEEVLPNFTFRLDDKTTRVTDANGIAVFSDMPCEGPTEHKIEEINIPSGFIVTFQNPFTLKFDCGKTSTIALGNQKLPTPAPTPKPTPTPTPAPVTPAKAVLPKAGTYELGVLPLSSLIYALLYFKKSRKRLKSSQRL